MGRFFDELKRRNVVRVGVAYVVVGWLVAQVAETLFPAFGTPEWVFRTLVVLIALGFPFALLFAWAFELTPEGIKKTRDVDLSSSLTHSTGRKLDFMIIGALVIALGYFVWERQGLIDASTSGGSAARSIAVLPFVNMSSSDEQEWFADGLTEEILNSLARIPDLLVASRTSSFVYKGSIKSVPEIAKELGVDHVLEGSVRRGGDRLRITAQLIRAEDGFHLWSETYDSELDDVIAIQENVAIEIATALKTALDPDALAAMMSAGTRSVQAYEAYLQGLAYGVSTQAGGDVYEFLNARDSFERAVTLDPDFSKAWWELALFWVIQLNTVGINSGITGLSEEQMLANYEAAVEKAIATESDPVNVLLYKANKATQDMKINEAQRLLEELLARRPNDIDAQITQMVSYGLTRRFDKADEVIRRFVEYDGRDPILMGFAMQYVQYSDDEELQHAMVKKSLEQFSDNVSTIYQTHRTQLTMGDIDAASRLLSAIQNSGMSASTRYLARLRQACAEGRVADAEDIVADYAVSGDVEAETRIIKWLTYKIMGDDESATEQLRELDETGKFREMFDYFSYGAFDPKPYPGLMATIADQNIEVDDVYPIRYRCNRTQAH